MKLNYCFCSSLVNILYSCIHALFNIRQLQYSVETESENQSAKRQNATTTLGLNMTVNYQRFIRALWVRPHCKYVRCDFTYFT